MGSVPHLPFSQGYVQTGLGLNMYQGSILLTDPGNPFEYYLFYGSGDTYNTTGYPPMHTNVHLRYSKINVVANAGQGAIVINGVDVEDSLQYGHLTAVRHANGRDWWVISHKLMSDQYVSWLVTPSGVSNTIRQSIGFNVWNKEHIGTITTSAQGDKIAIMIADEVTGPNVLKRLEVMDFDRCTGQLSNLNSASFQDTMNVPAPCAEFSPSGRYVYVTTTFFIYQFDTQNSSLQNSQILLDTFNGTFAPFAAYFYGLARAPDGKMYCHSYNGNYTLHVINEPDSAGLACNFVQNQFNTGLLYSAFNCLPNMPNYDLGPLSGSPCDTLTSLSENLGIDEKPLHIYPNPAVTHATINYQLEQNQAGILTIYNTLGEMVLEKTLLRWSSTTTIDVNLPSGIYQCLLQSGEKRQVGKLVVNK